MAASDVLDRTKPAALFDRDEEWKTLVTFATDPGPGPALGVVTGRFRQGKTYLLEALANALGGFYFGAQEAAEADTLRRLGADLARFTGHPQAGPWRGWEDAVDALLALGQSHPVPVVLDEFPRLVRQSPGLPALIARALRRARAAGEERARLLLCGSPQPMMRRLFGTPAGLGELASVTVDVCPLDYRQSAGLWGIADNPHLAVPVHSVAGGSPAYRFSYGAHDAPRDQDDFDAWMCRSVLNPETHLFHEAEHLLRDETEGRDGGLCHSVLEAVAFGYTTPGAVSDRAGRAQVDVVRCAGELWDCGLLAADQDAFRPSVQHWRVTEPVLAFGHVVIRPYRSALERQPTAEVWRTLRPVFEDLVVGPHFAQICRDWAARYAAPETFGEMVGGATRGSLEPLSEEENEADVVVTAADGAGPQHVLSVGTACWNEPIGGRRLDRLRQLIARLRAEGVATEGVRPALYGGAGFSDGLRAAAAAGEVLLVGPERLYGGR